MFIAILAVWAALELFYAFAPIPFERSAPVMGTTVRIKVTGKNAAHWAQRAIWEIKRLERSFSLFDKCSEIALINELSGRAPLQVSPDTFSVIKMAVEVNKLSRGAFDITMGQPSHLVIDEKNGKVMIRARNTPRLCSEQADHGAQSIDLGGIGKGYAVEAARRLLLKHGVKSAIIDMHSSIAVIGDGWKIGIRDPRVKGQGASSKKLLGVIVLNNSDALATSGQYEQPGHIIDPRTGKKADKCLSVTVIAKDAGLADALSTAVFVLGPVEGMKLVNKLGVKVIIVDKNGKIHRNFNS